MERNKVIETFQEQYLAVGKNVFNNIKRQFEDRAGTEFLNNASIKNHISFNLPIGKEFKTSNICIVKLNGHLAEPYVIVHDAVWPFKYAIYKLPNIVVHTVKDSINERDFSLFNLDIALHRAKDAEWCEANCQKTLSDDFRRTLGILDVHVNKIQDFGIPYSAGTWHTFEITYKDINPTTPDVE